MAETDFGALSTAQKKLWSLKVWRQGLDNSYWLANGFVSEGGNSPIQRITEITETERGDKVVMQLVAELTGDGVAGDNDLEGNEEPLVNDSIEMNIDQLRHAVKNRGKRSEQKTILRFRNQAKEKLGFWLGDTTDELLHLTAAGRAYTLTTGGATRSSTSQLPQLQFANDVAAASSARIIYSGAATSEGTLTASDTMNWDLIVKAQAMAHRKRIKPIKAGGREYYVMLMSTEQARDLKADPDYKAIVKDAGVRGESNPLFKNALAVVDGVVLHHHNKLFNTLDGTSGSQKWGSGNTIDGAQALLMGAQALGYATIGEAEWTESSLKDYGNKMGIGYGRMFGMLKPQFKSQYDSNSRQDFGLISVKTAAAA